MENTRAQLHYTEVIPSSAIWQECLSVYLDAFPADERREPAELARMHGVPGYRFFAVNYGDAFLASAEAPLRGILEVWDFNAFRFLEHLAVKPEWKGQGMGSLILRDYLSWSDKPVILEAETPVTPEAERRIRFYRKAGFVIAPVDYMQPPYYPGKNSVPMLLLTSPNVAAAELEKAIKTIRERVYYD